MKRSDWVLKSEEEDWGRKMPVDPIEDPGGGDDDDEPKQNK